MTLAARHRQGTARCEAQTGWRHTDYRQEPLQCHATRGLREVDGHKYCAAPGHREQVVAKARRA